MYNRIKPFLINTQLVILLILSYLLEYWEQFVKRLKNNKK